MFLCVWMYFKKFSEKYFLVFGKCYKEKTNPSPPGQNPDWRLTLAISPRRKTHHDRVGQTHHDRAVDREIAKHRAASRDRDRREREIAIDGAISRSVDRDLASTAPITISVKARSPSRIAIDGAGACDRRRLELGACERRGLVLSLSRTALIRDREQCEVLCDLSLSLSLRNSFEVKIGTEIHFRSQSLFFSVNGNQFPENPIFRTNQTLAFPEKHFRKWARLEREMNCGEIFL